MKIPLIKNTFYNESKVKKQIIKFIKREKKFTKGFYTELFEKKASEWLGTRYAVFVNSGSSANLCLLQALKNLNIIKENDNIGISAITWATNVMPVIQMSCKPIPIDVSKSTLNISPDNLLQTLKKTKLKALFITHALGLSDNIIEIKKICDDNNIILLEDNAESFGTEYQNKKLGTYGLASTTSLFVGHQYSSTIEGGLIFTDDFELYQMLKMVRSHGWSRDIVQVNWSGIDQYQSKDKFYEKYTFYDLAYNIRSTDLQAFIGLQVLPYLHEMVKKREIIYDNVFNNINIKHLDILEIKALTIFSAFCLPFIFKNKEDCEKYKRLFEKAGIEIRPIIAGNITRQPFWNKYIKKFYDLPNADYISDHGFYCGCYPEMTNKEINYIKDIINV